MTVLGGKEEEAEERKRERGFHDPRAKARGKIFPLQKEVISNRMVMR